MHRQTIPDHELLHRLRQEDNAAFALLYERYFPAVSRYVTHNSGSADDAADVFQEAVLVLLQKLRQNDFVLTASLKTYFFAIAKNTWLKRLRDNKLLPVEDMEIYQQNMTSLFDEPDDQPAKEEKLNSWLAKITQNCQRIIKALFFYKEPMRSLMQQMGWKNKHTAANQQYKCIQQVKREQQRAENNTAL